MSSYCTNIYVSSDAERPCPAWQQILLETAAGGVHRGTERVWADKVAGAAAAPGAYLKAAYASTVRPHTHWSLKAAYTSSVRPLTH